MIAIGQEREVRPHWRQVRELMLREADDVAAVRRRVLLAVLKDAKLDVNSLHLPLGYIDNRPRAASDRAANAL
jgi:hypothetical protein